MSDNLKKVQRCIVEVLGCKEEEVLPTSNLIHDLGADSLDVVEICMAVEEDFETDLTDEQMDGVTTVQDLVDLVSKQNP